MLFPNSDQSDSYRISFEYRPEYLYVYVSGEHDSYEISLRYWREIADECSKNEVKKVLIDEDIPEAISMGEMYRLASEIPQLGFFGIRIAFVDRYIEQQDSNEFGELVAQNRGMYGKIFNDFNAAETWLLSQ